MSYNLQDYVQQEVKRVLNAENIEMQEPDIEEVTTRVTFYIMDSFYPAIYDSIDVTMGGLPKDVLSK